MKCCPLNNSPECVCSGMKNITEWTTEPLLRAPITCLKSFQVQNRGGGGEVGWMWPQGSLRTLKHRSLSLTELQFGLLSNTTEKRAAFMELMDDIQSKWCGQKKNESFLSAEERFRVEEQEEGQAEQCESNCGAQFGLCPCFWFKIWMLIDAEGQKSNNDSLVPWRSGGTLWPLLVFFQRLSNSL